jgi:hypothetical protein
MSIFQLKENPAAGMAVKGFHKRKSTIYRMWITLSVAKVLALVLNFSSVFPI